MIKKILILVFSSLFIGSITLNAQSTLPDEKRVVFLATEQPLKDALIELSQKSGVNIAFQDELLPDDKYVNIAAKGKPLGQILDAMLKDTELKYRIIGNQLVLERDIKALAEGTQARVSGYIYDKNTGETLPYANVFTHDQQFGSSSNEYGFYSFTIPTGESHLYYSYIAYKSEIVDFALLKDTIIDAYLEPNTQLNEVVIIDTPSNVEPRVVPAVEVPIQKIASMVPLAGEADLVRFAQMSSGVSFGSDGFGGLSVRGGSLEHNLFLLDGVPMYDINHSLGLFSVFNNYAVKSAVFYKGTSPAKYGGRLASVLDIRTKEGNTKKFSGEVGIGTLAAKATVEGPLKKDNSSFIVSGRRTIIDPFLSSLTQANRQTAGAEGSTNYNFYDFFGKLNLGLSKKSRLFLTFFNGGDRLFVEDTNEGVDDALKIRSNDIFSFDSDNTLFAVKLNHQNSKNSFLKFNLYYSNYNLEVYENLALRTFDGGDTLVNATFDAGLFDSGIRDFGFHFDGELLTKKDHEINYGLHIINHRFSPGIIQGNEFTNLVYQAEVPTLTELHLNLDNDFLSGFESRIYGQYDYKFGSNHTLSLGVNQAIYRTTQPSEWHLVTEPRLNLLLDFSRVQFRFSANRMSQYSHRISTTSLGWPLDLWVPSTSRLTPQKSLLFSTELSYRLNPNNRIGVGGFVTYLNDIISYNSGDILSINSTSQWDIFLPQGSGRASGVEVWWSKDVGKLLMEVNYTLSLATRTYDDINLGNTFRYRFDRRHFLKSNLLYRINSNAEIAVNWMYGSGSPVSFPSFVSIVDGDLIVLFDEINGSQFKPFHRLDVGFNFYNKFDWGRLKFNIGAYNAYDRSNTHYLEVVPRNDGEIKEFSFLGVTPSIAVSLQF